MGYTGEEVQLSQEIFYYLLQHHQLAEDEEKRLYRAYTNSEKITALVQSQGEYAQCLVKRYGNVLYLIPQLDNNFLGFSRSQLKKRLCRSDSSEGDYYLLQFVILILLKEFYDGRGSSSKTREYLKIGQLQNSISYYLQQGAAAEENKLQEGLSYEAMREAYEALKSTDDGKTRRRTTKEGFLYHVLAFLQEQGLVDYLDQDEMITTTKRLDHLMDYYLLNKHNYPLVQTIIAGEGNE